METSKTHSWTSSREHCGKGTESLCDSVHQSACSDIVCLSNVRDYTQIFTNMTAYISAEQGK